MLIIFKLSEKSVKVNGLIKTLLSWWRIEQLLYLRDLKITTILTLSFLYIILSTDSSHAYIDPGSGSMLLQVLIASILGMLTVIKIYWARLKTFFSRKSDTNSSEETKNNHPDWPKFISWSKRFCFCKEPKHLPPN